MQARQSLVAERTDKIELLYLTCFSPELNPEESLSADHKQVIGKKYTPNSAARDKHDQPTAKS